MRKRLQRNSLGPKGVTPFVTTDQHRPIFKISIFSHGACPVIVKGNASFLTASERRALGGPAHGLHRTRGGPVWHGSRRERRPSPHPAHPSAEDRQRHPGAWSEAPRAGAAPPAEVTQTPRPRREGNPCLGHHPQPPQRKKHSRLQAGFIRGLVPKPGRSKHWKQGRLTRIGPWAGGGTGRRHAGQAASPGAPHQPAGQGRCCCCPPRPADHRVRPSRWPPSAESSAPVCRTAAS